MKINVQMGGPGMMMQPEMMMQSDMLMQSGMLMQPGMMIHPGGSVIMYQPKWGWEKLAERNGVFIKQKFDLVEVVTGCERENKYDIFAIENDGVKKGKAIFRAKEKSSWCARNCLLAHCQPFDVKINNQDPISDEIDGSSFLKLERDCACTFLCLNRPVMSVKNVEKGADEYLGKVRNPCLFCELGVDVYNAAEQKVYDIRASCCQCGFICMMCPCGQCQEVHFDLKNQTGEIVGSLEKTSQGCLKTAVGSDADNFSLLFPQNANKEEKALLMASVLLLDFSYFENNGKQNNNNVGVQF